VTDDKAPAEKPAIWTKVKGWFTRAKESDTAEKAGEVAGKAWEKTKDVAEKAWDKTRDVAGDVKEKVEEKIEERRGRGEDDEGEEKAE